MSEKYDIEPFASSLLADVRQRKDQETLSYRQDRDNMMRDQRDRQKRQMGYMLGAKVVMGIGNSMVSSATEKFMNQREVLDNNIKFKTSFNGASSRHTNRQEASKFQGGEDAWYTQHAMQHLSPTFATALPDTKNKRERDLLMYNESYKAGQLMKAEYKKAEKDDLMLIERAGTAGAAAYSDTLRASRPKNIGSAVYGKVKSLFNKGGNPLDESLLAGEDLLNSAEKSKAFGVLREAGLSSYRTKEKLEELTALGKQLPLGITSQEIIELNGYRDATGTYEKLPYNQVTYTNGEVGRYSIETGEEYLSSQQTLERSVANVIDRRKTELEQFEARVQPLVSKNDNKVFSEYMDIISKDQGDKQKENLATQLYAKIYLTRNELVKQGLKDGEALQIAISSHAINLKNQIGLEGMNHTKPQNNMLVGSDVSHPAVALLAFEEIEKRQEQTVFFRPEVKKILINNLSERKDFYTSRLSDGAELTLDRLMKKSDLFNAPTSTPKTSTLIDANQAAADAAAATAAGTGTAATGGSIVTGSPSVYLPQDIKDFKNSLPRGSLKRKLRGLSDSDVANGYSDELLSFIGDKYLGVDPKKPMPSGSARMVAVNSLTDDQLFVYGKLDKTQKSIYLQSLNLI